MEEHYLTHISFFSAENIRDPYIIQLLRIFVEFIMYVVVYKTLRTAMGLNGICLATRHYYVLVMLLKKNKRERVTHVFLLELF